MTHDAMSDERLHMFVDYQLPHRRLSVAVCRADERRLARNIDRYNADVPDDPMDPSSAEDLATALMGCAVRGLDAGDDDEGVWSDLDGSCWPLPRTNRAPLHRRVRFALRAAVRTWRAA
jgi:hypothetical protein